ncbi:TIGR04086 family membrane protein [Methanosphaera cuniculi]|uniref:TIGR04086 family membrane protein n=1 Tax=Methanosphaera cuniculi TaxID=1077256 RepID=UPI0026DD3364|nr:TIGR04086 family membrane protein [Methanosphaera cuniculi]
MSYVVCQNCKRFVQVNPYAPLSFDKCTNCGHTLEFARSPTELQLLLHGIEMPEVSYKKICKVCKSENPREVGSCMYCGSTEFNLQYDPESVKKYNESMIEAQNMQLNNLKQTGDANIPPEYADQMNKNPNPNPQVIINTEVKLDKSKQFMFGIISVIMGFIDFIFFVTLGLFLIAGDNIPETTEALVPFITQNMTSLSIIVVVALLLAGLIPIFIMPKMSYKNSFKMSAIIGVVIGICTLFVGYDPLVCIISMLIAAILTGLGGVIGEYIIHKLTNTLNSQ